MNATPPKVLVLTGGIGSGKSTFARAFEALGVPCIDADALARTVHQDASHPATMQIARAFPQAMAADGSLARGTLRSIFAVDPAANEELKRILRPAVLALADDWTRRQQTPYVVWESALAMDQALPAARVLVVDATDQMRAARVALRNPDWTSAQVASIIAMQLPRADYLARADDVVHNDGTLDDVRAQTLQLHHRYTDLWS
ncbi:dephospho-CoA kinase [Massilia violaceinigra]|uniref:Dephospho-CoA kinase n=1 Tax=Massilia violaceinigra TaxID=2045208 RepID=A0ABY4AHN5_9BURK|nr:dephospho-CoA kinase [Massilia violaceinigra]UOD33071.1 dephospho-CoA kinase [Massilia violaceinigra]